MKFTSNLLFVIMILLSLSHCGGAPSDRVPWTQDDLENQLSTNNVQSVELTEASERLWDYRVELKEPVDGVLVLGFTAPDVSETTRQIMREADVLVTYKRRSNWLSTLILQVLPIVLILGLFTGFMFILLRQARKHGE
jgi:ATP-dependent Zn protease